MKNAISAQHTRMFLENLNAPTTAYGNIVSATRSKPCVVVLDSVSDVMNGQPLTISGTNFRSLNNRAFVAQNIDGETKAVTLADSDTTGEPDPFVATNARYSVSAFIDVCVVSYQINKNNPEQVETTKLCDDAKTFEAGESDPGSLTFDFFIDPVDGDYQALADAEDDGRVRMFMIVYRNGSIRTLPVIVDTISEAGGVNQAIQGNANLRIVAPAVLTMPPGEVTPNYVLIADVQPDAVVQPGEVTLIINEMGGKAESFSIAWGDGNVTTTTNNVAVHTYENPGIFRPVITATIAGEPGAPWFAQNSVIVEPLNPYSAVATLNPGAGTAPLFVTLTLAETNGNADTFAVNWGDGTTETLTAPLGEHTYGEAGTFQVTITPTIWGIVQAAITPDPVKVEEPVQGVIGTVVSDNAQANGIATNIIRFRAFNPEGEPVATLLTITTNGIDVTVTPESGMTDPTTGELDIAITSREAAVITVTATALGFFEIRGNVDVTFIPPITESIEGISAADDVPADGIVAAGLMFIAKDAVGAVLAGAMLDFTTDSETAVLNMTDEVTDQNGRAPLTVTDTTAGTVTVTATARIGGATGTATAVFAPVIYADSLTATVTNDHEDADGESANIVTFTAFDDQNQPLAGAYIVTTTDSPSAVPSPAIGMTDTNGELAVSITTLSAGTVEVIGTSGTATDSVSVTFPLLHRLTTIVGEDGNGFAAAADPLTMVFTAYDQAGLIMEDVSITFTTDSTTALFDDGEGGTTKTLTLVTDANGQVTVGLFNGTAEDVTVTGSADFRWTDAYVLPTLVIEDAAARFRLARFGLTRFSM